MAGTRNIPLGLLSLLTGVAVSLAIGATLLLYQDSLRLTRERLLQIAGAKAALIRSAAVLAAAPVTPEALASGNSPLRRAIASTLPGFPPFGKTGVALVGFRDDRVVRFIPAMEDPPPAALAPVPWQAALGRPIGQALLGNRGTLIATDHRGVAVLAAYRPVPETPLGVVVRLELAELRDPFLRWGALASLLAGVLVVAGAWFLGRVLWPLLAELEQSRDMNRAIVDTVREGILTVDGGGIVREFNPGARALFGYAEAELSGMPAARLFPETDPGMWQRREFPGPSRILRPGDADAGHHRPGPRGGPLSRRALSQPHRPGRPLVHHGHRPGHHRAHPGRGRSAPQPAPAQDHHRRHSQPHLDEGPPAALPDGQPHLA